MAALPSYEVDPTLDAVHRAVEERENSKPKRGYLGASGIGHPCERLPWLELNHSDKSEPISYKGLYAIADGHATEQVIKDRLRLIPGIELWDIDEETKEQIGGIEGKFGWHVDGIILGLLQAPKTPHVFEAKACNEKKYNDLQKCKDKYGEKAALEAWDYTYFVQAQTYMGKLELMRHYLVCALPGGRDMISVRTEFQLDVYRAMMGKKDRILSAKTAPARISEHKSFYLCKFCRMREFCWSDATT